MAANWILTLIFITPDFAFLTNKTRRRGKSLAGRRAAGRLLSIHAIYFIQEKLN
jgi:hypothetical protein